jgi:hypothetical protein
MNLFGSTTTTRGTVIRILAQNHFGHSRRVVLMVYALLFFLIAVHPLMDFALQSGTIAACKCRGSTHPAAKGVPWYYWLTSHALIHGGSVGVVIRWFGYDWDTVALIAVLETVIHWCVDYGKCQKWYGIHMDQFCHIACKFVWWALLVKGVIGGSPSGM